MSARYKNAFGCASLAPLVVLLGSVGLAGSALAQDAPRAADSADTAGELAAEREQRESERAQRAAELAAEREERAAALSAEREERVAAREQRAEERDRLAEARQRLTEAAREVARLSAAARVAAGPAVAEAQQWLARSLMPAPRAMLGLSIEDAAEGVLVAAVSPGGPAAEAGVQTGDVIAAIDDIDLAANQDETPSDRLLARMAAVEPGETVRLTLVRDEAQHVVSVETAGDEQLTRRVRIIGPGGDGEGENLWLLPGRRGEAGPGAFVATMPSIRTPGVWRDLELIQLSPALGAYFGTEEGLLVVRAPDEEVLGLRDGDVILQIGGRVPSSPEHAMRILASFEPDEALEITIMREHERHTFEVELPQRRLRRR